MFTYSIFISSVTGKLFLKPNSNVAYWKKKTNQNHQKLMGRLNFVPKCLKERNFLAYLMAEAEIVKYSNKPHFFLKSVSVLSVDQWANKTFEGRKNVAGIQKQPELFFFRIWYKLRGFLWLLVVSLNVIHMGHFFLILSDHSKSVFWQISEVVRFMKRLT